jgi:hypothetical protein
MKRLTLSWVASLALAILGAGLPLNEALASEGHGGGHRSHHHRGGGGPGWGGVVVGTGIGFGLGWMSAPRPVYVAPVYSAYPPGYGWVEPAPVIIYRQPPPPVVIYREAPTVVYSQPAVPAAPEPIIYPRNGQNAQQTEVDRQDCNRWASTQRNAMGSSGAFNRATEACMDARGYTQR